LISEDVKSLDGKTIRKLNVLIREKFLIREQEQLSFWIDELEEAHKNYLQGSIDNIKCVIERMKNRHRAISSERREVMTDV
jgi:hypothetical protein